MACFLVSQPKKPAISWAAAKEMCLKGQGSWSSAPTLPRVLHSALKSSAQERHGPVYVDLRRPTKIIGWVKHLFHEERLRKLNCSAWKRRLCGDIAGFQYSEEALGE